MGDLSVSGCRVYQAFLHHQTAMQTTARGECRHVFNALSHEVDCNVYLKQQCPAGILALGMSDLSYSNQPSHR